MGTLGSPMGAKLEVPSSEERSGPTAVLMDLLGKR